MTIETSDLLRILQVMILELNFTESIIEKKRIIKKFPELKELLLIVYDQNYKFNVTGDKIIDYYKNNNFSYNNAFHNDIFALLLNLYKRKISGHFALDCCCRFLDDNFNYLDTIIKVFNKDLQCGISTKILEDVYDMNISTFSIPLAHNYKDSLCNFDLETWYFSRKLDGIRCITIKKGNKVKFYSRKGKEFKTLDYLKSEIRHTIKHDANMVLDGEICVLDVHGNDDFTAIKKQIHRKNYTIKNLSYHLFDCWPYEMFQKRKDGLPFRTKIQYLHERTKNNKLVKYLPQLLINSKNQFEAIISVLSNEWEGGMLRKDTPSLFKRSNNLLKVKRFKEKRFKVVGIINGYKKICGEIKSCCSSLEIKYKDCAVFVGSGLSDIQRLVWYKQPEKILGKVIRVKYFDESQDQYGSYSLRFPILKEVL